MSTVPADRIEPMRVAVLRKLARAILGAAMVVAIAWPAMGDINVDLRPELQAVQPGAEVRVGLYVVSDSDANQLMSAADIILGWDPVQVRLLGNDNTGAVPLLVSGFPSVDPYNLSETVPPQDGDGLYLAYAFGGQPVVATPAGTLLTTFRFQALGMTFGTEIRILPSAGTPVGHTIVYDGAIPGLDVSGSLGASTVVIRTCRNGDFDSDGDVDMHDFAWFQTCFTGEGGVASATCACVFDFDSDHDIDLADLDVMSSILTGPQ